jgi:7-carboxy-7-deazaguanine synthase
MRIAKMPNGTPEIYLTVQGEGATIGKPVIFVRTSGCNLTCSWCDTFYTWNFDDIARKNPHDTQAPVKREDFVKEMSVDEVVEYIESIGKGVTNAVFTGGEPTLQQGDLAKVAQKLREHDPKWYFEIETNGTQRIFEPMASLLNQINSSPKLVSSGNNPLAKNRPEAIKRLIEIHNTKGTGLCFKFVIMKEKWEQDLAEVKQWQKDCGVPSNLIYLMPEGITRDRIQESSVFLADIAQKEGFNLSTRLQILMFGDKRAI